MESFPSDAQKVIDRVLQQCPVPLQEQQRLERMNSVSPAADEDSRVKATLYGYHPRSWVDAPAKPDRLCFLVPSEVASSAAWQRFRGQLCDWLAGSPDDREYSIYLERADQVLAWRELIPPHYRFWKADGETR